MSIIFGKQQWPISPIGQVFVVVNMRHNNDLHQMYLNEQNLTMQKCILLVLTFLWGFCLATKHLAKISQHDALESCVFCW